MDQVIFGNCQISIVRNIRLDRNVDLKNWFASILAIDPKVEYYLNFGATVILIRQTDVAENGSYITTNLQPTGNLTYYPTKNHNQEVLNLIKIN